VAAVPEESDEAPGQHPVPDPRILQHDAGALFYRCGRFGLRYFKNTVMMTGKSKLNMTMRTIPSLLVERRWNRDARAEGDLRGQRGYF
jgi:hypothetical protein